MQILEFISRAQVKAQEYTNSAEVTFYVGTTSALEIHQRVVTRYCCNETIFYITITNTSTQDIRDLELIDWICSDNCFTIGCIQMQEGCYNLYPDYIRFYIPILRKEEQLYLALSICSNPLNHIVNCIKVGNYTRN